MKETNGITVMIATVFSKIKSTLSRQLFKIHGKEE